MVEAIRGTLAAEDGYPLSFIHYPARGPSRATVAMIHGIQSHAGWYTQSSTRLAEAGFDVYFLDRRGSGANAQDRGHCRGPRQLKDDLLRFLRMVRSTAAGRPVFLLAISWGGKLAVDAIQDHPDLVDGVIFIAPGWFAKIGPSLIEQINVVYSLLFRPRHSLPIPLSDPALFTANAEKQAYLRADPLSLRFGSARLLMTSRLLDLAIRKAPERIGSPALLMLAEHDRIIDNAATRDYFARFGSTDRTVIEYPEAHHTLEFEPDPEPFFADLIAWLSDRCPVAGRAPVATGHR